MLWCAKMCASSADVRPIVAQMWSRRKRTEASGASPRHRVGPRHIVPGLAVDNSAFRDIVQQRTCRRRLHADPLHPSEAARRTARFVTGRGAHDSRACGGTMDFKHVACAGC
jgi:hypothetical protein